MHKAVRRTLRGLKDQFPLASIYIVGHTERITRGPSEPAESLYRASRPTPQGDGAFARSYGTARLVWPVTKFPYLGNCNAHSLPRAVRPLYDGQNRGRRIGN